MLTSEMVHYNLVDEVVEKRNRIYQKAYKANPERFVNGKPKAKFPDNEVWINKHEGLKHVAIIFYPTSKNFVDFNRNNWLYCFILFEFFINLAMLT